MDFPFQWYQFGRDIAITIDRAGQLPDDVKHIWTTVADFEQFMSVRLSYVVQTLQEISDEEWILSYFMPVVRKVKACISLLTSVGFESRLLNKCQWCKAWTELLTHLETGNPVTQEKLEAFVSSGASAPAQVSTRPESTAVATGDSSAVQANFEDAVASAEQEEKATLHDVFTFVNEGKLQEYMIKCDSPLAFTLRQSSYPGIVIRHMCNVIKTELDRFAYGESFKSLLRNIMIRSVGNAKQLPVFVAKKLDETFKLYFTGSVTTTKTNYSFELLTIKIEKIQAASREYCGNHETCMSSTTYTCLP